MPAFPFSLHRAMRPAGGLLVAIALAAALGPRGGALSAQAAETQEQRAAALVAQMTADEKIAMVHGTGFAFNAGYAGHAPGVARLAIPDLYLADGPNGVGNGSTGVTAFPAAIALASTWDVALAAEYGAALGREQKGKGHNVALAPTINIVRVPNWGRTFETLGEDPYLTSRLAVAEIGGIQGEGVVATAKHLAANNQETLRTSIDVKVPERVLREIYLPAFHASIVEAKSGSVMCSYNKLGGTWACEHPWLLTDVLRRDWGFTGFVMSDWFATHSTAPAAKAGLDMEMPSGQTPRGPEYYGGALKKALSSGEAPATVLDQMVTRILVGMIRVGLLDRPASGSKDAPVSTPAHQALATRLAASGTVLLKNAGGVLPFDMARVRSIAVIGDAAQEHFKMTGGGSAAVVPSKPASPLAGITARAGEGLKVNYARGTLGSGALPAVPASVFTPSSGAGPGLTATYYPSADFTGTPAGTRVETTIGGGPQFGPSAPPFPGLPRVYSVRRTGTLLPPATGSYRFSLSGSGTAHLSIDGRPVVELASEFGAMEHGTIDLVAGKAVTLQLDYVSNGLFGGLQQFGWQAPDPAMRQAAVDAAKQSDVAVVFVDDQITEGSDRRTLALAGDQDRLIEAVAAVNPRTVVVLHTGTAVLMPWAPKVAAVLAAWYPGQASGDAIAAVLFGDVNPSGRLPITFPADEGQGPARTRASFPGDGKSVLYDEGLLVGYRWYDAKGQQPLFPFGHGLSYTTFKYGDVAATAGGTPAAPAVTVRTRVTNTGARAGAEVVQLYVGFPASAGEPPQQLRGFQKVVLAPGEARDVTFTLDAAAFSTWDEGAHGWKVVPGSFQVAIGASSRDLRATTSVSLPALK
jgi:beta-glucosidase